MKRVMKRLLCATLAAAFLCGTLSGCRRRIESPEETVERFCEAIRALDFETMTGLLYAPDSATIDALEDSLSQSQMFDLLQLCAESIGFKISASSPGSDGAGDATEVSVEFSYPNLYAIAQDYMDKNSTSLGEAVTDTFKRTVRGFIDWAYDRPAEQSPRKQTADFLTWTADALRKGNCEYLHVTIAFQCVNENARWSISFVPEDSLLHMLSFGLES